MFTIGLFVCLVGWLCLVQFFWFWVSKIVLTIGLFVCLVGQLLTFCLFGGCSQFWFVWWVNCSYFVCLVGARNLFVWWVECSHFCCLVGRVLTLWLFGESSTHNLISSSLLIFLIDCTSPPFDSSD